MECRRWRRAVVVVRLRQSRAARGAGRLHVAGRPWLGCVCVEVLWCERWGCGEVVWVTES
jgi:hypothetical protein